MKIIQAIQENGVFKPSEPLPEGILTRFNGVEYVVYEEGDTLPAAPEVDTVRQAALLEIARLESQITPRRLREAVLSTEGKDWLDAQDILITTERNKL